MDFSRQFFRPGKICLAERGFSKNSINLITFNQTLDKPIDKRVYGLLVVKYHSHIFVGKEISWTETRLERGSRFVLRMVFGFPK